MRKFKTSHNVSKYDYKRSTEQLTRRAIFFGFLTILTILLVIFIGVPFFIKKSNYLVKKKATPSSSIESIIPLPPRLISVPEATNSAQLLIAGFSAKNTLITVFLNGQAAATASSNEKGEFSLSALKLKKGKNIIYAITTEGKKQSSPSEEYTVIYDFQPPKLKINKPSTITSISYQPEVAIEGETESDVKLTINGHLILVNSKGHFATKLELAGGDNKILFVAQDAAGNSTSKTLFITYHL